MDWRAWLVAAFAVVALAGLAIAAEAQLETFLKPKDVTAGFGESSAVQGNLVALTGLMVAGAITMIGAIMARVPGRQRVLPLVTMFLSTYLLVLLIQTAMFNYQANDVARDALFAVSPFLFNGDAAPSVYIGPIAIILGAAMGIAASASRLLGRSRRLETPRDALRAAMGAYIIAVPFLAILIWGNLQVLFALPETDPGTLAYSFALPLLGLAGLALLVIGPIKIWQVALTVRNGRNGLAAHDAWIALRRAEWAALAVLAAVPLAATALEPLPLDILEAGTVFGLTARSHAQACMLVIIAALPMLPLQTPVLRILRADATLQGRHEAPSLVLAWTFTSAVAAGVALAGLGTWLVEGVLWAWVYASLPIAIFALVALRPGDGLMPAMMAAVVLWAIGNTVTGFFQLASNSAIQYHTSPGLLALWRAASVLLIAWAVARAAREHIDGLGRAFAWPLTAGLGAAVALIVFLELPFSAWVIFDSGAEYVGIGTVVASQDPPVRGVIHFLTGLSAFLAGLAVARLHRPEWFARKSSGLPALSPAPDGQA